MVFEAVLRLLPRVHCPCRARVGGSVTLRRSGDRWAFDAEELRQAITPRTRLILLNTPHNPTGKVFDGAELELIADLAVERDLIVVTDEVYEHLIFDGRTHMPLAGLPGMRDRTVAIGSGGKTLSVHGMEDRLGVRAAGAHRRHSHGQTVPHLRQRRTVPARRRNRARPAR